MLKEDILKISKDSNNIKPNLISRDLKIPTKTSLITIISGIRRCGKSTLLNQHLKERKKLIKLNFEDPRLTSFKTEDFQKILDHEIYLFDEIQNLKGWEQNIRFYHDKEKKIFLTGSNASMLSRELGTKLTGRYKLIELFPFSYKEFLVFKRKKPNTKTFKEYIETGGFPEYLKEKDLEYLQTLFENIISRDIVVRKGIKNESVIKQLANFLISNVGKLFSYNKVSKLLDIKSVRTTIDYCQYLQESYLIELIPNYSRSISKQINHPKKAYCIDSAMIKANSLSFSKDLGRVFENIIFLELRRKFKSIYYFKEDFECDFLIKEKNEITLAVQVCYNLNEENLDREIKGLKEALKKTNCKKGIIISLDQEDVIEGIKIIPAWKYFTNQ